MKKLKQAGKVIASMALLSVNSGCAYFGTVQTESRNDETTTITTRAKAYTLFSSKSDLARWKAVQSEKSQSAEVGGLSQQGGTNIIGALNAIAEILKVLPK